MRCCLKLASVVEISPCWQAVRPANLGVAQAINSASTTHADDCSKTTSALRRSWTSLRDIRLLPWLSQNRAPTAEETERVVTAVTPLLASQIHLTAKRTSSSNVQEEAVVALLTSKNWKRLPSRLVDRRASLGAHKFMKKTRFATNTRPQEVDIACGLGGTVVLAMECKVSNDTTNSVKRINDVLKKATAWRQHWGEGFVKPAALLQGVIGFKDVERLLDADIAVFWSHDLPRFERWIENSSVTL